MILGYLNVNLLDAQIGTVTTGPVDVRGFTQITAYLYGTGTVSGGTVKLSEAHDGAYAGTWSDIDVTLTPSTVTGGAVQANALPLGGYGFIRAQVTGAITGGGSIGIQLVGC